MSLLMEELNLTIPEYNRKIDPSKREENTMFEWTIPDQEVKRMRALYEENCCKAKKKLKTKSENDICSSTGPKKLKLLNGKKELTDVKATVSAGTDSGGSQNKTVIKEEVIMETVDLTSDDDNNSALLDTGINSGVVKNEIILC